MTRKIQTIKQKVRQEEYWHTGTPVEEGWYLCAIKHNDQLSYEATYFKDKFLWIDVSADMSEFVSAWHKIPQF